MTMLNIHRMARKSPNILFHEFLGRYNAASKCVYGFVEGNDDPSYYRSKIESLLPDTWEVEFCRTGNKDMVLALYNEFNWDRFQKERFVFFIDRDLTLFSSYSLPDEDNLYITDNYSIENDLVSKHICKVILEDMYNLSGIGPNELNQILDLFEEQLDIFREKLQHVMVCIIFWQRNGEKPCLDNIRMSHMFKFTAGNIHINPTPNGMANPEEYIHSRCDITYTPGLNHQSIEDEFKRAEGVQKFIRGKYLLWFIAEFPKSIHENIHLFSRIVSSSPNIHFTLGPGNAVFQLAPSARIPKSLKEFLENTCVSYAFTRERKPFGNRFITYLLDMISKYLPFIYPSE